MATGDDVRQKLKKKRQREMLAYFRETMQKEGLLAAIRRTVQFVRRRYGGARGRFWPKRAELARQRDADILGWPRLSICVPLYNTSRAFFDELLASVVAQSYPNWELCIANASDDAETVHELIGKYEDERIFCEDVENKGIAANTNRASKLATGHYLVFADHDDVLAPNALYEIARAVAHTEAGMLYSDEALFTRDPKRPSAGHFKPDYSPQYLLCCNYIAHLTAIRRDIFNKVGGMRSEFDGSQDHDLYLRVLEETGGAVHIQKVLYYWRQHPDSTSTGVEAKPYVETAALKAIDEHLERIGVRGEAAKGLFPSTYRVNYAIKGRPVVSIIIPNHEHIPELDRCIRALYGKTQYQNFEVLVVENHSRTVETFAYYQKLTQTYQDCRVLVYEEEGDASLSKICNFGRSGARGEYLLFLNNDTEVIGPNWLGEMLQLCQLEGVGAVGAMLYYPNDTVKHAGMITGLGGYVGFSHRTAERGKSGYMFRQACVQELSAVSGACMMVKTAVFDQAGGFDAGFAEHYCDVDLCLRLRRRGNSILYTPYAELYHYQKQNGKVEEGSEAHERLMAEQERLLERYGDELLHDPFYSPYLTLEREDFSESDVLPE